MSKWIALSHLAIEPIADRVVALTDEDWPRSTYTHAELCQDVRRWSAAFAASPGENWAVYEEDVRQFCAIILAAWHAGKSIFLLPDALPPTIENARPLVQGFVGSGIDRALGPLEPASVQSALSLELTPFDIDSARVAIFTSGSTGAPEAISKFLRQFHNEIEYQEERLGACMGEEGVVLGTVSHQHIYGFLDRVLWPMAAGRPTAPRRFFHEEIIASAKSLQRPVMIVYSPAHLKRMPQSLEWGALRGQIRLMLSSGGMLPTDSAHQAVQLTGATLFEIYGSSETGGIGWRIWNDAPAGQEPPWLAYGDVNWRVRDEQLEVNSVHMVPGTGWYLTADRIKPSGEGFYLLGRSDRIVKLEDKRVSLDSIEAKIVATGLASQCKLLMLAQTRRQSLAAVVTPSEEGRRLVLGSGRKGLVSALEAALADKIDAAVRPKRWRIVEKIPVNELNKTTAAVLQSLFRPVLPQPQWKTRASERAQLRLEAHPSLLVFDGHFPQLAILPGVALTHWAIRFAAEAFDLTDCTLTQLLGIKFLHVTAPGLALELDLQWSAADLTLEFVYTHGERTQARGRARFWRLSPH